MKPVISPKDHLLSIDDLDRDIVNLAARINAATFELLILVRQFDERAGWLQWGLNNCADWLAWRCDLSISAAREKVRVAHALKTLPLITKSFSTGELSYSKVRPLTRVARADNEESLLTFALKTTASRVEERCRELRCGTVDSVGEAQRVHSRRSLRVFRSAECGTMSITIELPLETGELLEKKLWIVPATPRPRKHRTASMSVGRHCRQMPWLRLRMRTSRVTVSRRRVPPITTWSRCMLIRQH